MIETNECINHYNKVRWEACVFWTIDIPFHFFIQAKDGIRYDLVTGVQTCAFRSLLNARVNASLEKKRLRDREQFYVKKLQEEQEKSERLLLSILPKPIAERLKQGEEPIADSFAEVSVLFADIVGFSRLTASIPPTELVSLLNDVFSEFDRLSEKDRKC